MDACAASSSSSRLEAVLSTRVRVGFGDDIRRAARAEGVRPGAFVRRAIEQELGRAGARPMTPEERQTVVDLGGEHGERLTQRINQGEGF